MTSCGEGEKKAHLDWCFHSSLSVVLVVGENEAETVECDRLLAYLRRKLSDCDWQLKHTATISLSSHNDNNNNNNNNNNENTHLLAQFDSVVADIHRDEQDELVVLTTAHSQHDARVLTLLNTLSKNNNNNTSNGACNKSVVCSSTLHTALASHRHAEKCGVAAVVAVSQASFYADVASLIDALVRRRNFYLEFARADDLDSFVHDVSRHSPALNADRCRLDRTAFANYVRSRHRQRSDDHADADEQHNTSLFVHVECRDAEAARVFHSYASSDDTLRKAAANPTLYSWTRLVDNRLNADHYVYEFEAWWPRLASACALETRDDLRYLLGKCDMAAFGVKLRRSLDCIERTLLEYGASRTCISFNGGKDCCAVLYLFYAVATRLAVPLPLNVLFIKMRPCDQFAEMDDFIERVVQGFYGGARTLAYLPLCDDDCASGNGNGTGATTRSLKSCLQVLKRTRPDIASILMGTRRSDSPYFERMGEFAPTDGDWPSYMRVNPILDWTYGEIWLLIRLLQLPYCSLYDRGYTSLDNKANSVPNKALKSCSQQQYAPAYWLANDELERDSRLKST